MGHFNSADTNILSALFCRVFTEVCNPCTVSDQRLLGETLDSFAKGRIHTGRLLPPFWRHFRFSGDSDLTIIVNPRLAEVIELLCSKGVLELKVISGDISPGSYLQHHSEKCWSDVSSSLNQDIDVVVAELNQRRTVVAGTS